MSPQTSSYRKAGSSMTVAHAGAIEQAESALRGWMIINADDWGRDRPTTDRSLACFQAHAISSVSAMVFMEDSERAAELALTWGVDAALHLNFTMAYTARPSPTRLLQFQEKLSRFLRSHRLAQAIYHPGLRGAFEYVVYAQFDEYERLYGAAPARIDGHHHMHLAANVLYQHLLPERVVLRRNFSFQSGEKGILNRAYRGLLDSRLARERHPMADYFYSMPPLEEPRLRRIVALSRNSVVEVETHPVNSDEFVFLMEGGMRQFGADGTTLADRYRLRLPVVPS